MSLLDSLKAQEALTYWKDCEIIGFGDADPEVLRAFYEDVVPARLAEARTQVGVRAYSRLLQRGQMAA